MKRPRRECRWFNASLAAIACALSAAATLRPTWAQQPPLAPNNYGVGPGMPQAPTGGYGGMGGYGGTQYGPGYSNFIPSAPSRPSAATRPSSWPGGQPDSGNSQPASGPAPMNPNGPAQNIYPQAPLPTNAQGKRIGRAAPAATRYPTVPSPFSVPTAQLEPTKGVLHFTGTEVVAVVGNDPILAGDLLPVIDEGLEARAKAMGKNLAEVPRDEIDAARLIEMKRQLNRAIETKMLFAEARRQIPKDNLPKVQEHANKIFEDNEVKRLMAGYNVKTRGELDIKLHEHGASLDAARNAFFESGVGTQFLRQSVKEESEITHEQMLAYYQEHLTEYETPPRARWEQILMKFSTHASKEEAYQILAQCGNKILRGAAFAEVAKAQSEDASATDGGIHDWTTKGSLVSKPLDSAIFGLPVGGMSPIIEDDRGFSIIRVVERKELTRELFSEAQVDIKKKIKKERASGQMERYVEQLRAKTKVWTIFDAASDGVTVASGPGTGARN